jgi:hypothetical protein
MSEISVNGRKKLATLQKEFSEKFNYLFLGFIVVEDRGKNVNVRSLDNTKSIAETRTKFSNKELTLHGRTLVKNMEEYFFVELGIACQIAVHNYQGKVLYFPIGDYFNGLSLSKANEWAKSQNCSEIKNVANFSKSKIF